MAADTCIGCGQTDEDPKHQILNMGPEGHFSTFWHHDCHTMVKPPCEICTQVLAEHSQDGKPLHGQALLASKIAQELSAAEVHAAAVVGGPADPNTTAHEHDPEQFAALPKAVQAVLTTPTTAPVASAPSDPGASA